ncbi:type II toxin-antitoxin system HicA family toxin [Desulfobacter latus]|uniref:Type II toxin-antitoxin system HicA family toxin n=1 Tax=Desulfobacter latus TaxID=2292 RepID=A0A850T5A0_9BACT|nr:type II toxin-antitoxin system HicA family toxin [Desulfobacter latus]
MGNIPVIKPKTIIRILGKLGFVEVRQKGSHKQWAHSHFPGYATANELCEFAICFK